MGRSPLAGCGCVEYAPDGGGGVEKLKDDVDDLTPEYGDWNVEVSGFWEKFALCDWEIPGFWYGSDGVGTGAGRAGGGMLLEPIARRIYNNTAILNVILKLDTFQQLSFKEVFYNLLFFIAPISPGTWFLIS